MKVAVRVQLKVFYRPPNLKLKVDKLAELQQFTLVRQPGSLTLIVENRSPYFATFSAATLTGGGQSHDIDMGMLAPFTQKKVDMSAEATWQPENVRYTLINDDGNSLVGNKSLGR